jgi:hypothetical protein
MSQTLYLDGCSYTYGLGLNSEDTLASLFKNIGKYNVTNNARPGKSNMAIAMDTYKNCKNYDCIVLGFTHSSRFYLKCNNNDIDFLNNRFNISTNDSLNGHQLELAYNEFHKYFYTMYESPFCDEYSDFLIDSICSYVINQGKKLVTFSCEKRNTTFKLLYPYFPPKMRLPDGHYNKEGTRYLYDLIGPRLNDNK